MKTMKKEKKKEVLTTRLYTQTELVYSPQTAYIRYSIPKGFAKETIQGAKNIAVYTCTKKELLSQKQVTTTIKVFIHQRFKEYNCLYESALVDRLDGYDHVGDYIEKSFKKIGDAYFDIGDNNYFEHGGVNKNGETEYIYGSRIDRNTLFAVIITNPKDNKPSTYKSILDYEVLLLKDNDEKLFEEEKPVGIKEVFETKDYRLESVVPDYMLLFQYDNLDFASFDINDLAHFKTKEYDGLYENYREYSWTGKKKFKDGTENPWFHRGFLYIEYKDGKKNPIAGKHPETFGEGFNTTLEYIQAMEDSKSSSKEITIKTKDGRELLYTLYEFNTDKYLQENRERIYIHELPNGDKFVFRTSNQFSQKILNKILGFNYTDKTDKTEK